jgi:hypothetical protein
MMIREAIDEVTTAVDALMTLAGQYERGQCISWGEIEAISGNRLENRSRHIIGKWRRRLEKEREIVTLCADGVGVRLLTHKETAREIPAIRQRRAYKQIRRGIRQVSTVDDSRLSDHERRLLAAQRANMADSRRDLFRSQRQLEKGSVATETNPRRKVTV